MRTSSFWVSSLRITMRSVCAELETSAAARGQFPVPPLRRDVAPHGTHGKGEPLAPLCHPLAVANVRVRENNDPEQSVCENESLDLCFLIIVLKSTRAINTTSIHIL